jgi:heme/copper-type cytochrome/quinol oxidase subunit 3
MLTVTLVIMAMLLFISSGVVLLVVTILEREDIPVAIRLVTLAILPGPLLFSCLGIAAWQVTHSLLWGIGIGAVSYLLPVGTGPAVQRVIWNVQRNLA